MLQLAYCRALELMQFKGGFLARTAHELRSPLNKIISLQQMILEGLCDSVEEEREFVAEAQAASLKMLEYLDFLIRISKIETGRVVPNIQAVSLADVFDQVKAMTHLQAADRNLRLMVEPPDASVYVWGDPAWLSNALTTLIDMAIDHSDERGTVSLAMATDSPLDTCHIWLDDDRQSRHWQEPITLHTLPDFDLTQSLSNSLRMGMVEAMLKAIQGRLTVLSHVSTDHPHTRLQCSLPRKV